MVMHSALKSAKKIREITFHQKKFTKKVPFDECGINTGPTQTKTFEIALF